MAYLFKGAHLKSEPIVKLVESIALSESEFILFNYTKKQKETLRLYNRKINQRTTFERFRKSTKVYIAKQKKSVMDAQTQTDPENTLVL